jgi:hypothetical protein
MLIIAQVLAFMFADMIREQPLCHYVSKRPVACGLDCPQIPLTGGLEGTGLLFKLTCDQDPRTGQSHTCCSAPVPSPMPNTYCSIVLLSAPVALVDYTRPPITHPAPVDMRLLCAPLCACPTPRPVPAACTPLPVCFVCKACPALAACLPPIAPCCLPPNATCAAYCAPHPWAPAPASLAPLHLPHATHLPCAPAFAHCWPLHRGSLEAQGLCTRCPHLAVVQVHTPATSATMHTGACTHCLRKPGSWPWTLGPALVPFAVCCSPCSN